MKFGGETIKKLASFALFLFFLGSEHFEREYTRFIRKLCDWQKCRAGGIKPLDTLPLVTASSTTNRRAARFLTP